MIIEPTVAVELPNPRAVGDVLIDGFGKGVGFLKHHANLQPDREGVDRRIIELSSFEEDVTAHAKAGNEVIDTVQTPDQGALAAAGGSDDRRDAAFRNDE